MAPTRLFPTPLEQLSGLMRQARDEGLSFDEAWMRALRPGQSIVMTNTPNAPAGAIRWSTDRADRLEWQKAVRLTRRAWRRAYERMPETRAEHALRYLGEAFSRLDEIALRRMAVGGIDRGTEVRSAA